METTGRHGFQEWSFTVNAMMLIIFERALCDLARELPSEALKTAHERGRSPMSFVEIEVAEVMGVEGGLQRLDSRGDLR